MIDRRAARITLDAAAGRTYADLAAEHHISIGRVGQIITSTLSRLGLSRKGVTKEEIGAALVRQHERESDDCGQTPRGFYYDELHYRRAVPSDYDYR